MLRPLLSSAFCVLALSGCVGRIDASTEEAAKKTVAALATGTDPKIKASVEAASKRYLDVYFGEAEKPPAAPEWFVVDHMNLEQFVRYVQHFLKEQPKTTNAEPGTPDRFVTKQYLSSLRIAKILLDKARTRAHNSGNYTVDQFEWSTPKLVPPDPNEHLGSNPVAFRVPFTNHTGFDVFHPAYRVVIKLPDVDYAAFDEILTAPDDAPVPSEFPTTVVLSCCTSQENETVNRMMRSLPEGTVIEYALVGVVDYGKRQALDNIIFPQESFDTLKRVEACLADVEQKPEDWTPDTAAQICREHDDLLKKRKDNPVKHHRLS